MNNPEDLSADQESVSPEESERIRIEQQIEKEQVSFVENIEQLNEDMDLLEDLGEEDLPEKDKSVLEKGFKELKDFIFANPIINVVGELYVVGGAIRGTIEHINNGKDVKEIVTNVLTNAAIFGIVKTIAYLGWGRKARKEREMKILAKENLDNISRVEDDDSENQIKKLKDEIEQGYDAG